MGRYWCYARVGAASHLPAELQEFEFKGQTDNRDDAERLAEFLIEGATYHESFVQDVQRGVCILSLITVRGEVA